jgi:hypothetical protein
MDSVVAFIQLLSQTAPIFTEDSISMRDFRDEVWGWIVQSASGISASTLNMEAFQGLGKEQRYNLAARYMRDLGVDGDSIVSAQGTSFY